MVSIVHGAVRPPVAPKEIIEQANLAAINLKRAGALLANAGGKPLGPLEKGQLRSDIEGASVLLRMIDGTSPVLGVQCQEFLYRTHRGDFLSAKRAMDIKAVRKVHLEIRSVAKEAETRQIVDMVNSVAAAIGAAKPGEQLQIQSMISAEQLLLAGSLRGKVERARKSLHLAGVEPFAVS